MKIAIDCRMIGSGGIGSYISALLPFFIKNNECILIGKKEQLLPFSTSTSSIIDCDIPTFSIKEFLSFPKSISSKINACDVFYSPYCNIPSGIKIPIFSTIHDVVFLDIKGLAGFIGTKARKFFYQYAVHKSSLIFTVSDFSKNRIFENLRTKNKKIITTYNALPQWFYEDVNKFRQLNKKDNYILFVGNIKRHKGLHTLLSSFSKLLESGIETKLMIVGNSENFRTSDNSIWNEISSLPKDSVVFTGRISDSELKDVYSKAKVLVQPSLYEGFGMPPLEALNLQTDVVLSDIPVFKEIYDGFPVTFFKCEDSDDLAEKLQKKWNTFGSSKITVPQKYSFEKTYKIIIDSLSDFLKN